MKRSDPRRAFTLIELLTVMAIIALMGGILGWALRDGSKAEALSSGQATVAGLLAAARGQAALHQNRASLIVDADPTDARFLRGVHVAVETAPSSGVWWFPDEGAVLPRDIYIVPADPGLPGTLSPAEDSGAPAWPATVRSSLTAMSPDSIVSAADGSPSKYLGLAVPLAATGMPDRGAGSRVVLAIAERTPDGVRFDQPQRVRGIAVSAYGVAILINDEAGFEF